MPVTQKDIDELEQHLANFTKAAEIVIATFKLQLDLDKQNGETK